MLRRSRPMYSHRRNHVSRQYSWLKTQPIIEEEVMCGKWRAYAVAALIAAFAALALAASGYHVVTTYKVGGDGGWDYLTADADARRVYISRGTHVMVIDADSGKSVGDIPD